MLAKIKNWFSIENNVNLIRDILFIGSLLAALIFGLSSCSNPPPVAYAAEVEPIDYRVITLTFDEYPTLVVPFRYTDYIAVCEGDFSEGSILCYAVDVVGDVYPRVNAKHVNTWYIKASDGVFYKCYSLVNGSWVEVASDFLTGSVEESEEVAIPNIQLSNCKYTSWDVSQYNYSNSPKILANLTLPSSIDVRLVNFRSAISAILISFMSILSAFAVFCMSNSIILCCIALSFIGFIILKAKDSMRGV